ncbi:MAG TPA: ATP-binding protein, partial [Polyangiaceae bacterium]|nr:ATP-binding protein [Polyangiaceae bacterium]
RALRESEERLRTILEHAPVMIDSFDAEGHVLLWNRECERTLGVSKEEIAQMEDPLAIFYPDPEERERVRRKIAAADGTFREFRVRAKDGSTRIQSWADFRLPTGTLISVGYDVTEQRATEAQLRQAQRLESVGQLTGGIAHDFNNLLTVIMACTDLVELRMPQNWPDVAGPLGELRQAARRGEEMIRKLLAFSRQEPRTFEHVDVGKLVHELAPTLRRLLPESIEMQLASNLSLPLIEADPGAIEQLLVNLVTNARDAMRHRGTLRVDTRVTHREAATYVVMSVMDNGSGMEESTRQRMFEPFFTTKPPGEGTGLGLAIVYGLVRQHGGFVEVRSAPGRGTVVEVFLPVTHDEALPSNRSIDIDASPRPLVLVVEDHEAIRRVARLALEDGGYEVLLAADGIEALHIIDAQDEIDLVISDIVMPGMNGPELYRLLSERASPPRFLFTSGYAALEQVSAAEALGVPLLRKPWSVADLLTSVEQTLRRS